MPRPKTTLRMRHSKRRMQVLQRWPVEDRRPLMGACGRREKGCSENGLELRCASARRHGKPEWEEFVMRKMVIGMIGTVLLSCAAYGQNTPSGPQACEHLAQLELPGAKILLAQTVAAGTFTPPSDSTPRPDGV